VKNPLYRGQGDVKRQKEKGKRKKEKGKSEESPLLMEPWGC
jgi:hypothetical protein